MRVAINTLSVDQSKGGIRTYLLSSLQALAAVRRDWRFVLLCGGYNEQLFLPAVNRNSNFELRLLPGARAGAIYRIFADQVLVPRALSGCDVLLTPSNVASLAASPPQVVVIQAPLALRVIRELPYVPRGLMGGFHRHYFDWALPHSMRKARRIVAVSRYLREKLVEQFPDAESKIAHVDEGSSFSGTAPAELVASGRYLLFVSSLFPYKNADKLIEAFARLKAGNHHPDLNLIICGKDPDGEQLPRLEALVARAGVVDSVEFRGQVPHADLEELYAGARVFVYPSCVETFGLPVLEAMACGAPVVCSDKMSVPEVAGDAAVVVNPFDVSAMAAAIRDVLENTERAEQLRAAGYERVKYFTWERCAEGLARELELAADAHST